MNMREMDLIGRIDVVTGLQNAIRHAHAIDALVQARHTVSQREGLNRRLVIHDNHMHDHLARVADMLGLALVKKAVTEEGQEVCCEG
jgi:hypothetical protein